MKPLLSRLPLTLPLWMLLLDTSALAQEGPRSTDVPNHMSLHTWFIIGVVGAFLAWSISYALQLQKEAIERKKERGDLLQQKEALLDKIADLENRKQEGQVNDQQYKREFKELKFRLGKVVEKIAHPEAQKPAKKTS